MFASDSKFWTKMSNEKKVYASVINLLRGKFAYKLDYCVNTPNIRALRDLNKRIESYVVYTQENTLSRKEAFAKAMQIEHLAYDGQFRDVLYSLDIPGIKDIFSIVLDKSKHEKVMLMRYVKENHV